MKITLTYNQRTDDSEAQGELYRPEEIKRLTAAIESLDHAVTAVEVSGPSAELVDKLLDAKPDLIFNVAEGSPHQGVAREALFPAIFEMMGIPYTGGRASVLYVGLDKRLTEKLLSARGITVPKGILLNPQNPELPDDMPLPLFVKPNYEGTSKGISQQSVVEDRGEAQRRIKELLAEYPEGVSVEQFIPGRELTVPFLDEWPGKILEIVEHEFLEKQGEHAIFDYQAKQSDHGVKSVCPAKLASPTRAAVLDCADKIRRALPCHDFGRIDFRLHENGTPYFIEINPLARLMPDGSLIVAATEKGLSYEEIMDCIIRSAARRYRIPLRPRVPDLLSARRRRGGCRTFGISIGRYPTGRFNAITDVEGIAVGHITHEEDNVPDPDHPAKTTCIRTGITAIVPGGIGLFNNHLQAGGFVLNGIGEMSGLTQAMEWGWLETPILLTNTMSVGTVHNGIIQHMIRQHPELGRKIDVIIPLVAETNDAFLNEVRLMPNTAEHAVEAIANARNGAVEQGSVGAGTGMISFDFAGGIGSSSRILTGERERYTLGVLVLSNFGKMRDLTIEGLVIGRELDPLYPYDIRRGKTYGSAIVVIATDAPLLSSQLNQISKRAALGLGRAGSYAASTSGEIIFAFSTGNHTSREAKEREPKINLEFVTATYVNKLYEAVVECTHEAVLNAMFNSAGQRGRDGHVAPAIPAELIADRCRAAGVQAGKDGE